MTPTHSDIFDRQESLRNPLLGSLVMHAGVFALAAAYAMYTQTHGDSWGNKTTLGGGSVEINAVETIPLPSRQGLKNPLAHDSESQVPTPPPKPKSARRQEIPPPDAIPLKTREAPRRPQPDYSAERFHPQPLRPNQIVSPEGQALVSPMLNMPGSGGVGIGNNSTMGNQFGWYVDLIKQRIAQKWRTTDVGAQNAPVVIVTFDINRDGAILPPRLTQRSGNYSLDTSTVRAIVEAAPFPALPNGYNGNSASFEIWFQLKR